MHDGSEVIAIPTRLITARFEARVTTHTADIEKAQLFRHRQFFSKDSTRQEKDDNRNLHSAQLDQDRFDSHCAHILIEDRKDARLLGCYRIRVFGQPAEISQSYSAQFYDLVALQTYPGYLMEIGRFCVDATQRDPEILRVAWAMLTHLVDCYQISLMFGCSSFEGTNPARYHDVFLLLRAAHLAPAQWMPGRNTDNIVDFTHDLPDRCASNLAMAQMPPLLRSYLSLGGWVSDHAVIDPHMKTLHVFTGVAVAQIPVARKRLLRALVQSCAFI